MERSSSKGKVVASTRESANETIPRLQIRRLLSGLGYSLGKFGAFDEPEVFGHINKALASAKKNYGVDIRHWQFFTPLDEMLVDETSIDLALVEKDKENINKYILQGAMVPVILASVLFLIGVIASLNAKHPHTVYENLLSGRNWVYWGALAGLVFGGGELIFTILFSTRKPKHWWQILGALFSVFFLFIGLQIWQEDKVPEPPEVEPDFHIKFSFGEKD